jgi:hypothetical protein
MKRHILKIIIKILYWLLFKKGNQLQPWDLTAAGWVIDESGFYVEPNIKDRDRVSIQFENHYYRIYHSEYRTFVALEYSREWLQIYLFALDYHGELKTRRLN